MSHDMSDKVFPLAKFDLGENLTPFVVARGIFGPQGVRTGVAITYTKRRNI